MSSHSQIVKMRNPKVFRFLLLYNILETVYRVVQAADGRTQAFIQVDGDLRYLVDGVSVPVHDLIPANDMPPVSFPDLDNQNVVTYESPVEFQPPMLLFNEHPVGMPHMEHVIIKNLNQDSSLHMLSISGNTLHFHCSFFQEKVIPPGGNTSFDVVFLARQEGPVENTLFIHTSLGSFKYQVTAVGTPNPYRLRPFVGVRMPLNSSYTPVIHMHNPYSSTLQLTELYTSGGDLHLELPDGESEAPRQLWEIPPYETKPIVRANFIARVEKNHTVYIRIKTNISHENHLLLPVEVDVTSAPGIYSPTEILDFGVMRSHDSPKTLSLSLLNSGQKHIHIANVIVTPVNEAVDVKFLPIKIPPDTVFSTQIASVTFSPGKALHPKQCFGKIVIKSKNNQYKLQIPYQVHLLRGYLDYNKSCTRFYVNQDWKNNEKEIRELTVTNKFNVTLIIFSASLPELAFPHFKVDIEKPIVLLPGKSSAPVLLTFQPQNKNLQLNTFLRLHTNISNFDIPLMCFSGRLKIFLPYAMNQSLIDFGTLGLGDKRSMIFAVINENPVDVNLKYWGSNATKTYVELVGIDEGNASTLAWRHNFSTLARSLILKPGHYAIFRLGLTAPMQEGVFGGQAFVETQYEKITLPFHLRIAKGALKVDDIVLENSFPGKIISQDLYVHSSFSHSMTVTGITPIPGDSRFSFEPLKHSEPVLYPHSKNLVGKIQFDLRKHCKNKCYTNLQTTTSMGHQWLLRMTLPADVCDIDKDLFKTLSGRWHALLDSEGRSINFTLKLDTTEVRGHVLRAHVSLQWPRLFSKQNLKFPITQIGNHSVKDFTIENPSNMPLIVQLVPLSHYPNYQDMIPLLSEKLGIKTHTLKHLTVDPELFSLRDLEEYNLTPENYISEYRKNVEEIFNIQSHKQSVVVFLTPGTKVKVRIGFTPKDDALKSSIILIRNNLTVLDAFVVQGQGGHGEIQFGNLSPGSDYSLNFELNEKVLKDCEGTKRFSPPNFTVRRTFIAKNIGALPVYINGFDINGRPCAAYGFKILNCEGFELKPNESKKVDIAFTPDFTLSRVERSLYIHTSLEPSEQRLQFTLTALIPRHMLAFCYKSFPRPYWEQYVYYIGSICTIFLVFCLLLFAYFDSKKILHSTFFPFATIGVPVEKIEKINFFDLKLLSTCSSIEVHTIEKSVEYSQNDIKKKKSIDQEDLSHENYSVTVHKTNASVNTTKNKDVHYKLCDENLADGSNFKHSKRKTKNKQNVNDFILEPELAEIKKSHHRNSWTRFLKPPFTFNSHTAPANKPSVGTQTSNDIDDSAVEVFDIPCEQEDINSIINCENNIKSKAKHKKEYKYIDSKTQFKKSNDGTTEEETSSTTTETSTTESDISEKDNRLPDVCVTAKPQKSRSLKNKGKNSYIECNNQVQLKPACDAEGFELNTKGKNNKKVKVDPNKVFGRDILHPNTLELPYRPKPVIFEQKQDLCEMQSGFKMSNSSLKSSATYNLQRNLASKYKSSQKLNFDKCIKRSPAFKKTKNNNLNKSSSLPECHIPVLNNFDDSLPVLQSEKVLYHEGSRKCFWFPGSSNMQSCVSKLNTYTSRPCSYSAVLSRDISPKSRDQTLHGNSQAFMNGYKNPTLVKQQKQLAPNSDSSFSNNLCTPDTSRAKRKAQCIADAHSNFSDSNTKIWSTHSDADIYTSVSNPSLLTKNDDLFDTSLHASNASDTLCSNINSIWGVQPLTLMQELQAERRHRLEEYKKQIALYNDWPGFDLPHVEESLWDSNYNPTVDSWRTNSGKGENKLAQPANQDDVSTEDSWKRISPLSWDNTLNSWSCKDIEPSIDDDDSLDNSTDKLSPVNSAAKSTENSKKDSSISFDPFRSLSTIWYPPTSELDSSLVPQPGNSPTWSFSLFPEQTITEINKAEPLANKDENETSKNETGQKLPD